MKEIIERFFHTAGYFDFKFDDLKNRSRLLNHLNTMTLVHIPLSEPKEEAAYVRTLKQHLKLVGRETIINDSIVESLRILAKSSRPAFRYMSVLSGSILVLWFAKNYINNLKTGNEDVSFNDFFTKLCDLFFINYLSDYSPEIRRLAEKELLKVVEMDEQIVLNLIWPRFNKRVTSTAADKSELQRTRILCFQIIGSLLSSQRLSLEDKVNVFKQVKKVILQSLSNPTLHNKSLLKTVLDLLLRSGLPLGKHLEDSEFDVVTRLIYCNEFSVALAAAEIILQIKFWEPQISVSIPAFTKLYLETKYEAPMIFVDVFYNSFEKYNWVEWHKILFGEVNAYHLDSSFYKALLELFSCFILKTCIASYIPSSHLKRDQNIHPRIQVENRKEYTRVFSITMIENLRSVEVFRCDKITNLVINLIGFFNSNLTPNLLELIICDIEKLWYSTTSEETVETIAHALTKLQNNYCSQGNLRNIIVKCMQGIHTQMLTELKAIVGNSSSINTLTGIKAYQLYVAAKFFPAEVSMTELWNTCIDGLSSFADAMTPRVDNVTMCFYLLHCLLEKSINEDIDTMRTKDSDNVTLNNLSVLKRKFKDLLPTLLEFISPEAFYPQHLQVVCICLALDGLKIVYYNWSIATNDSLKVSAGGLQAKDINYQSILVNHVKRFVLKILPKKCWVINVTGSKECVSCCTIISAALKGFVNANEQDTVTDILRALKKEKTHLPVLKNSGRVMATVEH